MHGVWGAEYSQGMTRKWKLVSHQTPVNLLHQGLGDRQDHSMAKPGGQEALLGNQQEARSRSSARRSSNALGKHGGQEMEGDGHVSRLS